MSENPRLCRPRLLEVDIEGCTHNSYKGERSAAKSRKGRIDRLSGSPQGREGRHRQPGQNPPDRQDPPDRQAPPGSERFCGLREV